MGMRGRRGGIDEVSVEGVVGWLCVVAGWVG
jgi:hypothetical protein